jgi:hypothetical protein
MAGYWTDHYCGSGRRTVTYYYPSWWERLLEYVLHDRTWTAYPPSAANSPQEGK